MEHITITELRKEIERKCEEPLTDEQFKILLSGFRKHCQRRGLYSPASVDVAVSRGWMGAQMAHYFKVYAFE